MKVVGLTGGIGSGKSVVSRMLRCKGFQVFDCDSEARRIMDESVSIRNAISESLGSHCLHDNGSLNRKKIADAVFSDGRKLEWLNGLVHGSVRADIRREISAAAQRGEHLFFIESAILRSSGIEAFCDAVWMVAAPIELRIERAAKRDSRSREEVTKRILAQKNEFCDPCPPKISIIDNDGSISLSSQLNCLLTEAMNAVKQ